jgi:hypothetical protein
MKAISEKKKATKKRKTKSSKRSKVNGFNNAKDFNELLENSIKIPII